MDVADIRRENLRRLIEMLGGATALALKLRYANGTYLSQIAGPNPVRTLGEKAARHIEDTLGLPKGWMDTQGGPMHFGSASAKGVAHGKSNVVSLHSEASPIVEQPPNGPADLPVFGQVQGGFDGVEVDYQTPVDHIPRPPMLKGSPNACGVYVTGESMEPRYYAGEIVLADPRKPARPGDFVVVELPEHRAIVKRLIRRNDNGATLAQLNPPSEEIISRDRIVGIYRIVGTVTE